MKFISVSLRLAPLAAAAVFVLAAGCTNNSTASNVPKKPIPLAPVGVNSTGIGGPGGASEDTRAVGTVATGEGDEPLDVRSGVSPVTSAPGSIRSAQGRP